MRDEYIQNRHAYVAMARKSFQEKNEMDSGYDRRRETVNATPDWYLIFFRIRFLLGVSLFAAFVVCDKMNLSVAGISMTEIAEQIQKMIEY